MKRTVLLVAGCMIAAFGEAQVVLNYGSNTVNKDEFLRAYNKNKTPVADKEKSVREYVELYAGFKMKVKEAQLLKLDTLEQQKTDLENFRHQIEDNFMNDEHTFKLLMQEAFQRSQYDLHVVHYTLPIDESMDPADTLKSYSDFKMFSEKLNSKNEADLLKLPAMVKSADMGYVTVFSLPYKYENIIYNLKPGQASALYRSKKAWHVFQLIDKRKSAGKWKVAQILFTSPDNADENTKARAVALADSVYQLLKSGSDFASMARIYSDDKLTYLNGGEMPEFGTGKFDYSFEKEVTQLNTDGEISKPFRTPFGIHIVKRISHSLIPDSLNDDALQFELKQKIMQDERVKTAKDRFAADIIKKIGFKVNSSVNTNDLFRYVDTVMLETESSYAFKESPISQKTIISFAKSGVKGEDWLNYAKDYRLNAEVYKGESNAEIWEQYKNVAALDYYRKHLEEFSADFKYQMQEFREGNLLFEIMERKIWSRAATDTEGLRKYYDANAAQYKWASSADVLIINCITKALAQQSMDSMLAGKDWHELVDTKQGEVQADSGRYEIAQINGREDAAAGSYSTIIQNADGTATFIRYFKQYQAGGQRSFDDAKGLVINDYQTLLEKKWVDELKKKYPVKVNEVILKQIINEIK
jgi:peptidyl-prolyl cis-trans isomerase SurA